MKIAIPTAQGRLCAHFGHCEQFTIVTVGNGAIKGSKALVPPAHEPGALPRWLHQQGVAAWGPKTRPTRSRRWLPCRWVAACMRGWAEKVGTLQIDSRPGRLFERNTQKRRAQSRAKRLQALKAKEAAA